MKTKEKYGDWLDAVKTVSTQDGSLTGKVISRKACTLTSCRGTRLGVRWPDGQLTWTCTKGMDNGKVKSNMRIM